ncbi:MAG: hypothetical protein L6V93_12900 [Clostridiales bacterium]|nr:MAG: hypothetical protein L6V93_12900 [Clostridiales bacterium]
MDKSRKSDYDSTTGMPTDETHFECGLPKYLAESLERMKKILENRGQRQKGLSLGYMLV